MSEFKPLKFQIVLSERVSTGNYENADVELTIDVDGTEFTARDIIFETRKMFLEWLELSRSEKLDWVNKASAVAGNGGVVLKKVESPKEEFKASLVEKGSFMRDSVPVPIPTSIPKQEVAKPVVAKQDAIMEKPTAWRPTTKNPEEVEWCPANEANLKDIELARSRGDGMWTLVDDRGRISIFRRK